MTAARSLTLDPRHGELADHAFHPVNRGDRSDDQIVAAIRGFAATFEGGWRCSIRPTVNCRSFQVTPGAVSPGNAGVDA